jgi:serine protease Do
VIVPDDWDTPVALGSGSIVDAQGLVLTNFHVIGDLDTGDWYNVAGNAYIGITNRPDRPPVPWYLARVVQDDPELDLAVLRIVADQHGSPLRKAVNLVAVPIGDSESVNVGDKLSVLGYPVVGMWSPGVISPSELDRFQATMTYAEGAVSGFFTVGNVKMYIKTDAEINEGNSGGMAVNGRGELVGIPTWSTFLGEVGGIRPVNLARHVIEAAQIEMESIP